MKKTVHTVIEIFDSVNLQNNILASVAYTAQRTIFLYEPRHEYGMEGVFAFLNEKMPGLIIDKIPVSARNAKETVREVLESLHKSVKDVIVEINGGNSIIGNYARECCRHYGIPCIVSDATSNRIIGVENAKEWEGAIEFPQLDFEDILMLQGRVFNRNMHMLAEEKYHERILAMSEYVFAHQSDVKFFYDFVHHKSEGELSEPGLHIVLNRVQDVSERILKIFKMLECQGFIRNFDYDDKKITFICTEPFVKEMLAVKGSWLEMYVYILAKRSGLFSEVYQSVMIGWDLEIRPKFNVENEIDVVLMKQGVPIFISCKMTNPKPDALNEIYALANSFGGYGAIPVLVTSSDVCNRSKTLWNRSEEMGVTLIDCQKLNREGMREFFENL